MAALLGIDVDRTISFTFIIGSAIAAVAGTVYLIRYGGVNFSDGFVTGVKAFTAAVLGGIGSLPGAVLGRLLHSRHHPDLHPVRPPRPAGRRESLRWSPRPRPRCLPPHRVFPRKRCALPSATHSRPQSSPSACASRL